jgi:hypothetical protein
MQRSAVLVATLATFAASSIARAQTPVGNEFQVNTYTPGDQAYPVVCRDSGGDAVVAWESRLQDGDGNGVFAQRYDAAGDRRGSEFQVNSFTAGDQEAPALACGAEGSFFVVWQSSGQDGDGLGIFGRRYDADGVPLGSEFQVNTHTSDTQVLPAVCSPGGAGFVVAWESYGQDGEGYGVFAQRYDGAGSPAGTEFQINAYTSYTQDQPAIACAPNGSFLVAWSSAGQDGNGYGVFGRRFDASGAPLGTEFQVNSYTTEDQDAPNVSADGTGNFIVVWQSHNYQDGDSYGIFGQRIDASGAALGTEFQINTYTSYSQEAPSVASEPGGGFVVVWSSGQEPEAYGYYGIYGQRYDSAGNHAGGEFHVNTTVAGDQGSYYGYGDGVSVATDAEGNFTVVWQSTHPFEPTQDGDGFGVFGQRFASGTACRGDCDGDGMVSIDELITGVNIALGNGDVSSCRAFDANKDGQVRIDELVAAVNAALIGCSAV